MMIMEIISARNAQQQVNSVGGGQGCIVNAAAIVPGAGNIEMLIPATKVRSMLQTSLTVTARRKNS